MKPVMVMATTEHGISVTYQCYSFKYGWGRRCPDRNTDKCFRCKHCRAEMSGEDARKLMEAYKH